MPMGAGTGGTAGTMTGLRFNPRETAGDELGYGVSSTKYNPRDPDDKSKEEEKQRKEKDEREEAKSGMQHIKLKVKNKKREMQEALKETGELSDLTGPAGSRGGDLDQAIGALSGTGSAMGGGPGAVPVNLPVMGAFGQGGAFTRSWDVLKRSDTETIESVQAKERGKKAARHRKQKSTESVRERRGKKSGKPLRVLFRDPTRRAGPAVHQRVHSHPKKQGPPRITSPLYRGTGSRPHIAQQPRQREQRIRRQQMSRYMPPSPVKPPLPFQTGAAPSALAPKVGVQNALAGPKRITQPRTASTPMGAGFSGGAMASPFAMSEDVLELDGLLLKFFGAKAKLGQADVAEFKHLVREVKRLLQGLKKSEKPKGDDGEKPSPNAHRRQTSRPTGPTETDPDDDPTMWGTHPYGLLVSRRGHQ